MNRRLIVFGIVAVVGIVAVLALSLTLLTPSSSGSGGKPSPTAYIVTNQSSCMAHQSNFNCTLVLARSAGQIGASDIASVRINGTQAQISGMTATEDSVSVNAGITILAVNRGLNDVNLTPVTVANVIVYLKDGTTVSALVPSQLAE